MELDDYEDEDEDLRVPRPEAPPEPAKDVRTVVKISDRAR